MKRKLISLFTAITIIMSLIGTMPLAANAETAASSISLGDYVQMGTYNGQPILWRCVAFEKVTDGVIDSTQIKTAYEDGYLPLMLADTSIGDKEFDAVGSNTSGSHGRGSDRTQKGSSYWGDSNIRDWLNSANDTVTYTCGNAPSYSSEKGFLTNFNTSEIAAMKTVTQKSLLADADKDISGAEGSAAHTYNPSISDIMQNYADAYSEQITDTMFLLDVQQVKNVYDNCGEYYKLSGNYWLRSPDSYNNYFVRVVYLDLGVGSHSASYDCNDVRPAFFLNPQSEFSSGTGAKDTPYSFNAPPHSHDMSAECGQTDAVNFDHALTSQDGKLYIDGAVLEPTVETSSAYIDLPDGNYYLAENVTLANLMNIKGNVSLCLNGHTLDMGEAHIRIIKTTNGEKIGNLKLCDCGEGGQITGAYNGASNIAALIETSGEFSMYGGSVINTSNGNLNNKQAVSAFTGTVRLYGGEVVSYNSNAVYVDTNTGSSLHLSGAPKITGAANRADIYLDNEYIERIITLDAPLTNTEPYRVAAGGENVFTSGWNEQMGTAAFSDYFISVTKGRFIAKDENNELAFVDYAITEQPSAANSYTVTANGAPDYEPASYKWYSAEVVTEAVTDQNASVCETYDNTSSYNSETGLWTGAQKMTDTFYFQNLDLSKGDIVKVTPSESLNNVSAVLNGGNGNSLSAKTTNADGEYVFTAAADDKYKFFFSTYYSNIPSVKATVTKTNKGEAAAGQTAAQFTGDTYGTYLCEVTYADGTVLRSDVVNYVPVNYEFGIKYENEKAVVTAKEDGTYTVIFASYDGGGKLLNLSAEDKTLQKGENDPIEPKQGFVSGEKVKVMLWDSLNGMKPLCAADGN